MGELGLTTRPTAKWSAKPVGDSKLHGMLKGSVEGQLFSGRHEPLIDRDLFDRVQDVLAALSSRGQRDRVLKHYLKACCSAGGGHLVGRKDRLIYTEAMGRTIKL